MSGLEAHLGGQPQASGAGPAGAPADRRGGRPGRAASRSLVVIALVASVYFARIAAPVLTPFIAAMFIAALAYPLERWLLRRHVPEGLAVLIIVLLALAILGGLGVFLRESLVLIADELPLYLERLTELWGRLRPHLGFVGRDLGNLGGGGGGPQLAPLASIAASTVGSVLTFFEKLGLVIFYVVFMLLLRRRLGPRLDEALGPERATPAMATVAEIESKASRYLGIRTAICAVTGAVAWIILALFGVDFALLWAALTFVAQYVPIAGPIAASLPPILVALVQLPSPVTALWVAVALTAWHLLVGYLLEPRVFGRGMQLNQLILLFGLVFFGWLWGVLGAILAVPILMTARIVAEHVAGLRPLAVLLKEE